MFRASNQYNKIRVLGQGSFGQASLINDAANPTKFYVVKVCNLDFIANLGSANDEQQKMVSMAIQEAELMKCITHPNIVKVYSSFQEGNLFHIVMEYCDSGTLKDAIKAQKGEPFPEEKVVSWTAQLAMALQWLHNKQILHRDIKPDNVFLTSKGGSEVVKLGDFGIAKTLGQGATSARTMIGTPTHMAPELWQGEAYTFKCEVWALGVIVYELIALSLPFQVSSEANFLALGMLICHRSPKPLPETFSVELRSLVTDKLMERDASKRVEMAQVVGDPCIFPVIVDMTASGDREEPRLATLPTSPVVEMLEMSQTGKTKRQETTIREDGHKKSCMKSTNARIACIALPQFTIGLALLLMGAIIKTSFGEITEFVRATNAFDTPTTIVIASGAAHIVLGIVGIWATYRRSKWALTFFLLLSGALFILDIVGPSFGLAMRENLEVQIQREFESFGKEYDKSPSVEREINWIQSSLACCGHWNATQWEQELGRKEIPDSCCESLPKHSTRPANKCKLDMVINMQGCAKPLYDKLSAPLTAIGGVGLALALFHLSTMLGILFLICRCRDHYDIY